MKTLQGIIDNAKKIVFFGGAGVSTASGIPDFRSAGGLYAKEYEGLTAEMLLSSSFFYMHPDIFYDFYRKYMLYPNARPNAAHEALFRLEQQGKLTGIVTQNIDGLHRAAGNKYIYEVHGTVHENHCLDCNRFFGLDWLMSTEGVPRCPDCGGVVKPSVVLYGEPLDHLVVMGACREISRCDTLIVAGTSLAVEPAASLLDYFHGRELVVINREMTKADRRATLVIHGNVEEVLGGIR